MPSQECVHTLCSKPNFRFHCRANSAPVLLSMYGAASVPDSAGNQVVTNRSRWRVASVKTNVLVPIWFTPWGSGSTSDPDLQSTALEELGKRANSTSRTVASLAFVIDSWTCELIYRRRSPYCVSTDVVDVQSRFRSLTFKKAKHKRKLVLSPVNINCPGVNEDASDTRLRSCGCRKCVGIIFVLAREHHWCPTSVLSHLGTTDFALHSRHSLWSTRHRRRAEAGWTMVTTTQVVLSVNA